MRISDWSSDVCSSDLPLQCRQSLRCLERRVLRETVMANDSKKRVHIDQKIVGWSVLRGPANDAAADVDPLSLRIDRREEGSWESVTTKINLTSASGSKQLYFVIGFGGVCGWIAGERVCRERQLEFFGV